MNDHRRVSHDRGRARYERPRKSREMNGTTDCTDNSRTQDLLNPGGSAKASTILLPDQIQVIREAVKSGWVVFHSDEVAAGDKDAMKAIAQSLGKPSHRDGGPLWPVMARSSIGTFSMTREHADLHTDSTFHRRPERHFLLFCVVPAECGGGTNQLLRLSDAVDGIEDGGFVTSADVRSLRQATWSWESPKVFQRSRTSSEPPRQAVLASNGTVRWRSDNLRVETPEQARTAEHFRDYLNSHAAVEAVLLNAGDVLYCDNIRVLHGRRAFQDPRRLLYRARLW